MRQNYNDLGLRGIYAIWWRETIVFFREKPRIVSVIINPIIWLLLFGGGLGASVNISGIDYQQFIFAGILVQTFLFSSLFYGAYLVWDKKIDLLKSILVSPLGRSQIFLGKVFGGVTISIIETIIVLIVGYLIGIPLTLYAALAAIMIVIVASAALTAVGLTIGSFMESPEGFQLISSLVIFPLFFLSGALFPPENLPGPLGILVSLNPITYIVDSLRGVLMETQYFSSSLNLTALIGFLIVTNIIGMKAFERMKI